MFSSPDVKHVLEQIRAGSTGVRKELGEPL